MEKASPGTATIADGTAGPIVRPLSEKAASWLEKRGISEETATRYNVGSATHPVIGSCIAFQFVRGEQTVNIKFRSGDKRFAQTKGGEQCFWNVAALEDKSLADEPLVITEGEIDALSAIEAGFVRAVSSPAGAPATLSTGEIEPANDKRFACVHMDWDSLSKIRDIIIATDADGPGQNLLIEYKRRLGAVRCRFVTYPDGCKDLNEVLVKFGKDAVAKILTDSKPFPIKGVYALADYPETNIQPFEIPWGWGREHYKPFRGSFAVITGVPGSGKSLFANALVAGMCLQHGLKASIASFETPVRPLLHNELRRVLTSFKGGWNFADADRFIQERLRFISQEPQGYQDEDIDIEWLLDRMSDSVVRNGTDIFLIDPWNEIEHKRRKDETETDYTGRAIRELKRFGRSRNCMVIIVAHPTKMKDGNGNIREPHLYDISGSSHWYNKADHGIIVHRPDENEPIMKVRVQKSKYHDIVGRPGEFHMRRRPDGSFAEYIPPEDF